MITEPVISGLINAVCAFAFVWVISDIRLIVKLYSARNHRNMYRILLKQNNVIRSLKYLSDKIHEEKETKE